MESKPKKKVYLAGPMTNMPEKNRPLFMTYEKRWQEAGWEVINPALFFGVGSDPGVFVCRHRSIKGLIECDAIAMLPGSLDEEHEGSFCRAECSLSCDIGLSVYWADQYPIPRGDE